MVYERNSVMVMKQTRVFLIFFCDTRFFSAAYFKVVELESEEVL